MESLIEEYVDSYCHQIPSRELLEEFLLYGSQNTDRVFAFGMCLMLNKEWHKKNISKASQNTNIPSFKYKNVNGKIIRVME